MQFYQLYYEDVTYLVDNYKKKTNNIATKINNPALKSLIKEKGK